MILKNQFVLENKKNQISEKSSDPRIRLAPDVYSAFTVLQREFQLNKLKR